MDSVDLPVRPVQTPHTTDLLSLLSDCVKYSFKKMIKVTVHEEVQVNVTSAQRRLVRVISYTNTVTQIQIQQDEKNQSSKTSIDRNSCSVPFDDGDHWMITLHL